MTYQVAGNEDDRHGCDVSFQDPVCFVICHTKKPGPPHSIPCRNCLMVSRAPREEKLYDHDTILLVILSDFQSRQSFER
jgi:hypothetical protein